MSDDREIIVIGGGIWGLSTAFHLAKLGGARIRVLERDADIASETTPRAAGLVGQIRSSPTMCRGFSMHWVCCLNSRTRPVTRPACTGPAVCSSP